MLRKIHAFDVSSIMPLEVKNPTTSPWECEYFHDRAISFPKIDSQMASRKVMHVLRRSEDEIKLPAGGLRGYARPVMFKQSEGDSSLWPARITRIFLVEHLSQSLERWFTNRPRDK